MTAPPTSAAAHAPKGTPDLSAHLPGAGPTGAWRRIDRLVVIVFMVGLSLPALALLAGVRPRPIENRALYTMPPLTASSLGDVGWYGAVDRYVNDNMRLRPIAVRLRSELIARLGGSSNPAVVRGTGDWLFSREELVPTCTHTPEETAAQLDRARAAFAASGQEFRLVVAPDKHAIYPERLADIGLPVPCTDGRRAATRAALAARSDFAIDGWASLLAARAADPQGPSLFYGQDSHWTPTGALQAVRALALSWGPQMWSDSDVAQGPSRNQVQDLARQLGIQRTERTVQLELRPDVTLKRTTIAEPVKLENARAIYHHAATGDPRLLRGKTLVIYDSFFGLNMNMVSSLFADTTWIHVGDLRNHPEVVAALGSFDRIVLERVERGLYATNIETLLRPLVRTPRN